MEGRVLGFVIRGIVSGNILSGTALFSFKGYDVIEKVGVPYWGAVSKL